MDKEFRFSNLNDCNMELGVIGGEYFIKSGPELRDMEWKKIIGFVDEDKNTYVYLPIGSLIRISSQNFRIVNSNKFVTNEIQDKVLYGESEGFVDDLCLEDELGKLHRLRKFKGRYARVLGMKNNFKKKNLKKE